VQSDFVAIPAVLAQFELVRRIDSIASCIVISTLALTTSKNH